MTGAQRAQLIGRSRGQMADAGTPNPWYGYSAQALLADLGLATTGAAAQSWQGMAVADTLADAYEAAYLAVHPIAHWDYERRDVYDRAAWDMNGTA